MYCCFGIIVVALTSVNAMSRFETTSETADRHFIIALVFVKFILCITLGLILILGKAS